MYVTGDDVQQGDRMATWALRTCLLRRISGGVAGSEKGIRLTTSLYKL
jgi:hypothetical protein